MVAVEARQQCGLVLFPFAQQFRRRGIRVLDADTSETAKRAERAHMLMRLQAMLRVAVFVGHEGIDQPTEDSGAVRYVQLRPLRRSVPNVAGAWKNFRAARIDEALTGSVIQKKGHRTGVALYRGPRTRPAGVAAFLDFIAPPSAGHAGQRSLVLGIRRHDAAAAQLNIALCRGADARRRSVLDDAIFRPRLERVPKRIHGGRREADDDEPKFESIAGHGRILVFRC